MPLTQKSHPLAFSPQSPEIACSWVTVVWWVRCPNPHTACRIRTPRRRFGSSSMRWTRPLIDGTFGGPDELMKLLVMPLHRFGAAQATVVSLGEMGRRGIGNAWIGWCSVSDCVRNGCRRHWIGVTSCISGTSIGPRGYLNRRLLGLCRRGHLFLRFFCCYCGGMHSCWGCFLLALTGFFPSVPDPASLPCAVSSHLCVCTARGAENPKTRYGGWRTPPSADCTPTTRSAPLWSIGI